MTDKSEDIVNAPSHYTEGGIETIEFIKAKTSKDQYEGYLIGNAMKYISRWDKKGHTPVNIKKAIWYLERVLKDIYPKG